MFVCESYKTEDYEDELRGSMAINVYGFWDGDNEDYKEKIDIASNDERNRYIRMKAWAFAGIISASHVLVYLLPD